MRHKRRGIWHSITWGEFLERSRAIGLALKRLGLEPGEVVSILSESRPEWLYVDMAAQAMGFPSHGIHPTDPVRRVNAQLALAQTRAVFVEDAAQAAKVLAPSTAVPHLPHLRHVIVFDDRGLREVHDPRLVSLSALMATGDGATSIFESRVLAGGEDGIGWLAATTGSMGEPRIAAFTQSAVLRQGQATRAATGAVDGDRTLCFASLAHAAERVLAAVLPVLGESVVHFPESPATVLNDLREVEPHWVHAPPRFWEKLRARTESTALLTPARERALYRRSVDSGAADWLARAARRHVRASLGLTRARRVFSGGALASPSLAGWYASIGSPLVDLYESAETCGVCLLDAATARLSANGELLVRPAALLAGYWVGGERMAPPQLTEDGWLRTGDLATRDPSGVLRVSGRLSAASATSAVAPDDGFAQDAVEAALLDSSYIASAMLVGQDIGHCACLVELDEESVLNYAQSAGIPFSDYASLMAKPEVHALVQERIDEVNAGLAPSKRIVRFVVLPRRLSTQDGELTATLRIQREAVRRSFARQIDSLLTA